MEEDLGGNAVLAEAVQRAHARRDHRLRRRKCRAPDQAARATRRLAADSNVSEQVKRLRRDLDATVDELKVTPNHVKRLVDTALELDGERSTPSSAADEPPSSPDPDRAGHEDVDRVDCSRTSTGTTDGPRRRPITFDAGKAAKGRARHRARAPRPPARRHGRTALRAAVWSGHTACTG